MPPKKRARESEGDVGGDDESPVVPAAVPALAPSAQISAHFPKVSEILPGQRFFSHPFKLLRHTWKIQIARVKAADGKCSLGVYLWGPKNESTMWEIVVDVRFTLMSHDAAVTNKTQSASMTFSHKAEAWGLHPFLPWESQEDIKAFVSADDKMTFIVDLTQKKATGYRKLHSFDFQAEDPRHDLTIKIKDKTLFANKTVLAAHSFMLDRMLFGGFKESTQNEIELNEVDYEAFHEILHFIYPADRDVTDDLTKLTALLKTADYFEMKTIVDKIERHLIVSDKFTISAKLKLSGDFGMVDLQDHCLRTFNDIKSIKQLNQTPEYKNFNEATKVALFEKVMRLKE